MGAPWPMLGGCPKRASRHEASATYSSTIRWSIPTPAAESSPAISVAGFLWVGTSDGRAVALSAFYGNLITSVKLGDQPVTSSPASRSATTGRWPACTFSTLMWPPASRAE